MVAAAPAAAAVAPPLASAALQAALDLSRAVTRQSVTDAVHARRARVSAGIDTFLGSLPGAADLPPVERITVYLAHRLHYGGRRPPTPEGYRYMAASTLRAELAALRSASLSTYGHVVWDPATSAGNPFLAAEVDTFMAGAEKLLLRVGVTVEPAMEAYPVEVVKAIQEIRREVAAEPTGSARRVLLLQSAFMILAGLVWGDRVSDVVRRDFEDVVLLRSGADAAATLADGLLDIDGQPLPVPDAGGFVAVTYVLDKGALLSRDPLLARRRQVYPLLQDCDMCPTFALTELQLAYAENFARGTTGSGAAPRDPHLATSGPIIKAFTYGNNAYVDRVKENTFDKRVNTLLKRLGGGTLAHLTAHSFRRGGSQAIQAAGGSSECILGHFRWRQLQTALQYLRRCRDPELPDPVASQPGCTQGVADLGALALLSATAPRRSLASSVRLPSSPPAAQAGVRAPPPPATTRAGSRPAGAATAPFIPSGRI